MLALSTLFFAVPAQPETGDPAFALGLNWPGLSARYFFTRQWACELSLQAETGVFLFGPRLLFYVYDYSTLRFYGGLEADSVFFQEEHSRGSGWAGELFAGVEWFPWQRVSVQADIGPAWIKLTDADTGLFIEDAQEWVARLGVNLYFFRSPAP
ncbi:MAG: hypothetical protein AB1439_03175 [candidate division FCPU426 bacterium]